MMKRIFSVAVVSAVFVWACSEAEEGAPDATTPTGAEAGVDGGPGSSDATTNPDRPVVPEGDASLGKGVVIFNEVAPSAEWVELVNAGTAAIDISGFAVADREKDGGAPKVEDAARMPAGLILSPKSYVLIQAGGLDSGVDCPAGGQSYCVKGEFGISNKDGETLYFLDATNHVIDELDYPPSGVTKPDTYGRIPSGDPAGTFAANTATPGAANVAK